MNRNVNRKIQELFTYFE